MKKLCAWVLTVVILMTQSLAFAELVGNQNIFQPINPDGSFDVIEPDEQKPKNEEDEPASNWDHRHEWSEWKIIEPADGCSMGRRERTCLICGVSTIERFYSDATLYRGVKEKGDAVRQLQEALIEQGYLDGKPDGMFGPNTQNAVKQFQRDHDFYQDGIAWEPVLDALYDTEQVHLEITDVVPPFALCAGETTASVANEGYSVTGVSWVHGGTAMAAGELFVQGETYTVQVTLLADDAEGKEYTASINGEGASVAHEEGSEVIVVSCDMIASDGRGAGGEEIPGLSITLETKVLNSPSVNPNFFVVGETIQFQTVAANEGSLSVADLKMMSSLPGVEPFSYWWFNFNKTLTFDHSYTVTVEDVFAGKVVDLVTASFVYKPYGYNSSEEYPGSVSAAPVEVPVGIDEGMLAISQTLASTPANGQYYAQGEQVAYQIMVENKGDHDLLGVDVNGRMLGGTGTINSKIDTLDVLKKGEVHEFTYTHTVTDGDAVFGSITNEVSATAGDQYGFRYNAKSNSITVSTNTPIYSVKVATDLVNHPKFHPNFFIEDETLQFETVVANRSNVALLDVQMNSTISGSSVVPVARLEPGESVTFPYSYKVTNADALAGSILNQSGINFRYEDTGMMDSKGANDVTVPTILSDEIILDGGESMIGASTTTVVGMPEYSYIEVKPAESYVVGTIVVSPSTPAPETTEKPAATPESAATPEPAAPTTTKALEKTHAASSVQTSAEQPLWLTVVGTPVDNLVGRTDYATSASLYQAQLSGSEGTGMVLSAASDAELGNQIVYIADFEGKNYFSAINGMLDYSVDLADKPVLFGPMGARDTYRIAALLRMRVSDEALSLTNLSDLSSEMIFKVYKTALTMGAARTEDVEIAYGDDLLTLVVWDREHRGQCLVVVAAKQ